MVQPSSFADLRIAYSPLPGQYANRRALVFALCGVSSFYAGALLLFLLCVLVRSMVEQRLRRTDAVVRLSVALGRRSAGAGRLVLERCE